MGGKRDRDFLGMDPPFAGQAVPADGKEGPVGTGGKTGEVVFDVDYEWNELERTTSPQPEIKGRTVLEIRKALDEFPGDAWRGKWMKDMWKEWETEWGDGLGRAGGKLWVDEDRWEGNYIAKVRMKFLLVVPRWLDRSEAESDVQERWDAMMKSLLNHEEKHIQIAAHWAGELAKELKGAFVSEIRDKHRKISKKMRDAQKKLDVESANGTDPDHDYGGVTF